MGEAGETVRLWRWDLDVPPGRLALFRSCLSEDERARAERRVTPLLRNRALAARGGLRQALGRHLGVPAAGLRFTSGPFGKPLLAGAGAALHFNLSHSGGLALLGVSEQGRIGVDVEQAAALPSELLATLAPAEAALIAATAAADQAAAFFDCWTRKEAFVKATGLGLSLPFDSFDVVSQPGFVQLLAPAPDAVRPGGSRVWRTCGIGPTNSCFAAISAEGGVEDMGWTIEDLFDEVLTHSRSN
ncbi:4'-phosphopantetheinyl transferase family protein [Lichenicoccus sp.]|uniref:4'-phosphopantetheinyl transferase family protein n=1 Tax=Lichenicoccus sp. TaxID=2781899 RepID=UPI003D140C5B